MNQLDSLYQELILEHSKRPIGNETLEPAEGALVFSHREYNPSCGDEIELTVGVDQTSHRLQQLAWQGQGCSISMASASMLTQLVREEGWTAETAKARVALFRELLRSRGAGAPGDEALGDAIAFQGVGKFVMRVKCAMLAWVALEANIAQFESAETSP